MEKNIGGIYEIVACGISVGNHSEEVNNFYRNLALSQMFIAKDYKETITILENLCIGER